MCSDVIRNSFRLNLVGFPINVALGLEVEGKGGVEDRGEIKHLKQAGFGTSFL